MPQAHKTPAKTIWRVTRHTRGRRAVALANEENRNLFVGMLALMSWAMKFDVLALTVLPHRIDYVVYDAEGVLGRATQQYHVHLVRNLQLRRAMELRKDPDHIEGASPALEPGRRCRYERLFTYDQTLEHCTQVMTLPEKLGMSQRSAIVLALPDNLDQPIKASLDPDDSCLYLETHVQPHIQRASSLTLSPRPGANPTQWRRALTDAVENRRATIRREANIDEHIGFPHWDPNYGDQPPAPSRTPALDSQIEERDKPRRQRQLEDQAAWYKKYMAARIAFCEGQHDALFPPETFYFDERYLMRCGKSRGTWPTRPRWFLWLERLAVLARAGPG